MARVKIEPKEESSSHVVEDTDQQLDRDILTLIQQNESMSNEELTKLTEGVYTTEQRVAAVNRLLGSGTLEIINGLRGSFILRLKKQQGVRFGTAEEQAVYEAIADANSTGIWIRDIRERTGLPQAQLTRLLKSLEKQKAIKSVKTVGNTRKCYMLFDVEPDESLTGGAFFSDQFYYYIQVNMRIKKNSLYSFTSNI
uniref:DNA-directed RNA polymerase III subunit RPC6 n=1 Tax=Steinernema glaseri TaxID=37863 RepID=A0A1I8ALJ4_9BILA